MAAIKIPKPRLPDFLLRSVTTWIFVIGVLALLWTSFYTVPAEAEGVVLRFGRFSHVVPSGLHFKLPFGIDTQEIVPVKRQLKQEFGFATAGATNPSQANQQGEWLEEKSMVTGDLNAVYVEWVIQYR